MRARIRIARTARRVGAAILISSLALPVCARADAPDPDAVLDALVRLGPEALLARLGDLKTRLAEVEAQAKAARDQSANLDRQLEQIRMGLARYDALVTALAPPPAPEKTSKAAMKDAKPRINFADHVNPIFQERCVECHNEEKRRGGLSLVTFATAMDGGSSGDVVSPFESDSSRLMQLVLWDLEPIMPPEGDPLSDDQLDLIRAWIESGALANKNSKPAVAKARPKVAPGEAFFAAAVVDGPPPMPETKLAAVHTARARAIPARAVATSPTAPLAAVGGERQILLYDLQTYALLGALPFAEGDVYTLTFSLNGELLLAGGGEEGAAQSTVLWNVRRAERVGTYGKGKDTILAADISPDHTMVAIGGPDRRVRVFDAADGSLLYTLDAHTDWIQAIRFTPDGELLATADRAGGLYFWQAANGRSVETLRGHNAAIHDLAYTIDSNIMASAGAQGEVMLWDTWKYKKIRSFKAHAGDVLSLDFNRAGQLVTSGRDGLTKTWDLNGKNLAAFDSAGDWAYRTRFGAKDAVVLTGNWRGEVMVWNAASKERVATLTTNPEPVVIVASTEKQSAGAP